MVFAGLVLVSFLVGANALVEWLEARNIVHTTGAPDALQFVEEPLFARDGDRWVTTPYARESMVESSFAVEKGGRFRAFVFGGSFAMGTPWVHQQSGGAGGIPDYLRAELSRRLDPELVEVVNVAAGGVNSGWVSKAAAELSRHEADVWVVATCNNEGSPSPSVARDYLQKQGGYRLLRKLLARPTEEAEWFTPQDSDSQVVREDFADNVRSVLDRAAERGIPVVLATLPVHLSYRGFDPGHLMDDAIPREVPDPAADVTLPDTAGVPTELVGRWSSCTAGILAFEAGVFEVARSLLSRCLSEPADPVREAPYITTCLALADLETGRRHESNPARLAARWGPCLAGGIMELYTGDLERSRELLGQCDDVAEAMRWIGFAHLRQEQFEAATRVLEQSVELRPSNRCRPSFNQFLREEAASRSGVFLADLEAAAKKAAPGGVPGNEQFIDYCHMTGAGYATLGARVVEQVERVAPTLVREDWALLPPEQFCEEHGVPPHADQEAVVEALRRMY